jgi:hypothetical protein
MFSAVVVLDVIIAIANLRFLITIKKLIFCFEGVFYS